MLCRRFSVFHNFSSKAIRLRDVKLHNNQLKYFSVSSVRGQKIKVALDSKLENQLVNDEKKPRQHFGINKQTVPTLPTRIQNAIPKVIGDYPLKALEEKGEELHRYIKCRKAPMEEANIKQKKNEIEELVLSDPDKFKLPKLSGDDEQSLKHFNARKKQVVQQVLQQRVYSWKPINYDEYQSLVYLIGRSTMEYAVIMRIFQEIVKRDPKFKPRSYFDFGSGVGTGVWAASELWKSSIFEYYLVDASKYMNDLSDLLLRDGNVNKEMFLRNVYHRQFLPARDDKYDIVLSAYSLFEMPSLKNRLEVANNLWNKTSNYLIFVEVGTNAGFTLLNEIRDFLIQIGKLNNEDSFIFSPCTHERSCPRYELNDGTPCNFDVRYLTPKVLGTSHQRKDTYSYLVLKKGKPTEESDRWPRIVRTPLLRHKHVICRMCASDGKIQEGIFTVAKHGKHIYRCAKSSNCGDQLPITLLESDTIQEEDDTK